MKSIKLTRMHLLIVVFAILALGSMGVMVYESFEGEMVDNEVGIPKSEIPEGMEDLYILKSQIVPPVCPKCPDVSVCEKKSKCPPCPPCGRCPQPAFTCKKVPDYSSDFFDDGRGQVDPEMDPMNDGRKYRPGSLLMDESDGKRRAGGSVMPVLNDFSSF